MAKVKKLYFKLNLNMLLFFLGVIAGTTAINCFYGYYGNTSSDMLNNYFGSIDSYSSYGEVFWGIFIRRILLAAFIIAVFELFNNIWTVYLLVTVLGTFAGIVMTVFSMNIGIKSIGAFIIICFPHVFIYALAVLILIRIKFSGYYILKLKASYKNNFYSKDINKRKGYLTAAVIFIIGILAETLNALYILPAVSSLFL